MMTPKIMLRAAPCGIIKNHKPAARVKQTSLTINDSLSGCSAAGEKILRPNPRAPKKPTMPNNSASSVVAVNFYIYVKTRPTCSVNKACSAVFAAKNFATLTSASVNPPGLNVADSSRRYPYT
jgi:hypothetical protein